MRYLLCLIAFALIAADAHAQILYGESPVVRGNVRIEWTQTSHQFRNVEGEPRVEESKSEAKGKLSSAVTLLIIHPDADKTITEYRDGRAKGWWAQPPVMIGGASYTRTYNKDEVPGAASVPTEPISIQSASQYWELRCEDQGLRLSGRREHSGTSYKMRLSFSVRPDSTGREYRVITGLTGLDLAKMQGTQEYAEFYDDCKATWLPLNDDPPFMSNISPRILSEDALLNTEEDMIDDEGKVYGHYERTFATIPIAEFNSYLKDPSKPRSFTAHFSERSETRENESELVGTVTIDLMPGVVDSGKLILSMDGDYDKWYPTLNDDQSMKRISMSASLSDQKLEPTKIRLSLGDVSRYPGMATNYPINGFGTLDLFFPKEQPAGIEYVDSFTVVTKDKVRTATAFILINDYAAQGRLYAAALDKPYQSKEKYGDLAFLQLPKDRNANNIADAWEQEVGLGDGHVATEDNDELPRGQKRNGDGYSLFEEYRGLIALDHVAGKADKFAKKGKHARMNPLHKDVAILDESGLWKKYYAAPNPAELTWHLLDRSQAVIKPLDIHGEDISEDADNRLVNVNTPSELKRTRQRAIHLVYHSPQYPPDTDRTTAGAAVSIGGMTLGNTLYVWMRQLPELEMVMRPRLDKGRNNRRYTEAEKREAVLVQQENTVIHEVGHALGIRHHCNGVVKLVYEGKEVLVTCKDIDKNDEFEQEAARRGVHSCAMMYSFARPGEFIMKEILNHQTRYCREGETYIDDLMNIQPADNCFGQIDVSCQQSAP